MQNIVFVLLFLLSCKKEKETTPTPSTIPTTPTVFQGIKNINYNGIHVDVVIDKPALQEVDVLLVYHGTVMYDSLIVGAAQNALDGFKNILDRKDMMIVSVAYPEENLLMGDNIK